MIEGRRYYVGGNEVFWLRETERGMWSRNGSIVIVGRDG